MPRPLDGLVLAVDFDGTIVTHMFPKIGEPVPGAIEFLRRLIDLGAVVYLWTCRDGSYLEQAVSYCAGAGIELAGANKRYISPYAGNTKLHAHVYIDDSALGISLHDNGSVNWRDVQTMLATYLYTKFYDTGWFKHVVLMKELE